MARFWIGTSGWNYRHWKGRFYPNDLPARDWLAHYSRHFRTVELNSTFYREPSHKAWESWRDTAPDGFRFAVKAHRYLTHRRRLKDAEDSLSRVLAGWDEMESETALGIPFGVRISMKVPFSIKSAETRQVAKGNFSGVGERSKTMPIGE